MEKYVDLKNFKKLDIRVGKIKKVRDFKNAIKPSYKIWIDFGNKIGLKKSSAQITKLYDKEDLINKKVIAIVNFKPLQIADFLSEVLILGIYNESGVVLLSPDKDVKVGDKIG
ncbi:MAG: tRNA-binding protein [Halanaerobiales bacterium]|nr:tRNA-binding protein [Halanaerobiales bacterium]